MTKLKCKVCTINLHNIRREASWQGLCGNVMKGVLNFVDCIEGAHKSNILRHTKSGGLHSRAKTKYGTWSSSPSAMLPEQATNAPSDEKIKNQSRKEL